MKARFFRLLSFLCLTLVCAAAYAVTDTILARGFAPRTAFELHDFDNVNLFNGNLMVHIPLGQEYGSNGSLRYRFGLTYNSHIWDYYNQSVVGSLQYSVQLSYINSLYQINPDDLPTGGGTEGTESVPYGNAGVGWSFSLGELRGTRDAHPGTQGIMYVTPDGTEIEFAASMHGAEPTQPGTTLYSINEPVLRLRTISVAAGQAPAREVDFPDGTRQRFTCVDRCGDPQDAQWNLDWIADQFGNVLLIDRAPTAKRPASGTWVWTYREGTLLNAESRDNPYFTGSDADRADFELIREHVATFSISHSPWECRLDRLELSAYTPDASMQAAARRAVYVFHYQGDAQIYRDTVIPWSHPDLRVPYSSNDGKIAVSMLTSVDMPNGGSGGTADTGGGSGPRLGRWAFTYYYGPESTLQPITIGSSTLYTSLIAGRLRRVTPPTSRNGGYEYQYSQRVYPTRGCHSPGGALSPQPPTRLTGVSSRQQLDDAGNAIGNPWLYIGRAHLDPPDANNCRIAREFIGGVMDPAGTVSLSFFSIDVNAPLDYGKPFSPVESDSVNHAGVIRFLTSRTIAARNYATFASDLGGNITAMLEAYRATPPGDISTYGSILRSTYALYEESHADCGYLDPTGNCTHKFLRRSSEHTRYNDDSQHAADAYTESTHSEFDGLGHYRRDDTFGNFRAVGLGGAGYEQHTTYTWYNPAVTYNAGDALPAGAPDPTQSWFTEKFTSKSESEAGRTLATSYTVDPTRAYVTQKRISEKTTPADAHFQVPVSTKDLITNIARTGGSDGAGAITTITEDHLGGDRSASGAEYTTKTVYQFGRMKTKFYLGCTGDVFHIEEQNEIDPNTGLPRKFGDSSGVYTAYDYDRLGRVISVTPQGEAAQKYSYTSETASDVNDGTTNSLTVTRPGSQGTGPMSAYTADHLGRITRESRTLPAGANQKNYTYDVLGRVTSESITTDATRQPVGLNATAYTYDALGRVLAVARPDHTTTTEEYFGARSVNHKVSDVALDRPQSVVTTDFRDSFGRLARVNDNAARADYDYDPAGRLLSATLTPVGSNGAIQHRFFDYDGRGLLVGERHPEMLIDFNANTFVEVHHSYDSLGLPTQLRYVNDSVAANAFDLDIDYDAAGRVIDVTSAHIPAGANQPPTVRHYQYYPKDAGNAAAGKLQTATRYTYTWDPAATNNPLTYVVKRELTYNPATGRSATVKVSSPNSNFAAVTTYNFDDLGELAQTTYGAPASPMAVSAPQRVVGQRFSRGFLTGLDYGATAPTTRFLNLGYHPTEIVNDVCFTTSTLCTSHDVISMEDSSGMARPHEFQWTYNGGVAGSGVYAYDGAGNISAIGSDLYQYDKAGRLANATNGSAASSQQQSYTYDASGNLTSMPSGATVSVNTNRLSTATYDGAGNVTSLPDLRPSVRSRYPSATLRYRYDYSGAVVHFAARGLSRSFVYDDQGERVAILDAGAAQPARERWSVRGLDNKVIRDFDRKNGAWSWSKDYLYRNGTPAGTISLNGSAEEVHQFHVDHLGTVRLVTTGTGALFGGLAGPYPQKYWPFGDPMISAALPDRLVFTGHERDDDGTLETQADLDYMHARFYAPVAGRFLSLDAAKGKPSAPQSWNRYAYAGDDPLNFTDPSGDVPNRTAWRAAEEAVFAYLRERYGAENVFTNVKLTDATGQVRWADAVVKYGDGAYGLVEVKSGGAKAVAKQLAFDERALRAGKVILDTANRPGLGERGAEIAVKNFEYFAKVAPNTRLVTETAAAGGESLLKQSASFAGEGFAALGEFLVRAPGQFLTMFFDAAPAGDTCENQGIQACLAQHGHSPTVMPLP